MCRLAEYITYVTVYPCPCGKTVSKEALDVNVTTVDCSPPPICAHTPTVGYKNDEYWLPVPWQFASG